MKLTKQLQGKQIKRKPPKRLPRQVLPVSLERRMAKQLWAIIAGFYAAFDDAIKELDGAMPGDIAARIDRIDALLFGRSYVTDAEKPKSTLPPGFLKKIEAAARKVARSLDTKRYQTFLERHARATDRWSEQEFTKQAKAAVGVDIIAANPRLAKQVKGFTKENVDLITKVGKDTKRRVERIVFESVEKGRNYQDLTRRLQDDMDIGRRRATLIARDQTGKLYGQINAERQREVGITRFVWRTSNDQRVRDEHAELEGETFEYANPPSEGLPGEAIQCRCYAEPVFDMLADL